MNGIERVHVILLLAGLIAGLTVLWLVQPMPVAYDASFHVRFAADFKVSLDQAWGWPDWDARPYGGRGTPAFRFYAPLVYAVSATWQRLGCHVTTALKLTVSFFLVVGALGAWRWMRELGRDDLRGPAAFVLATAPVIATHIFQMLMFQNLCAVLLLPWFLVGLTIAEHQLPRGIRLGAIAYALMAWTHLPATMMAGYLATAWGAARSLMRRRWQPLLAVFASAGLGLALAAPYLLPALTGLRDLNFDRLDTKVPWLRADFFDDPVASEPDRPGEPTLWDAVRQVLGYALIVTAILGIGGLGRSLLAPAHSVPTGTATAPAVGQASDQRPAASARPESRDEADPGRLAAAGLAGIAGIALTFRFSRHLWPWLPGCAVLQFPWRWLMPATMFLLPWLAMPVAAACTDPRGRRPIWAVFVVPWLLLTAAIQHIAKPFPDPDLSNAMQVTLYYPWEYVPRSCPNPKDLPPDAGEPHRLKLADGNGTVQVTTRHFNRVVFDADIGPEASATLWIDTHYHPGWRLRRDGQSVPLLASGPGGTMLATLPPGRARCILDRPWPPARYAGVAGMALGLIILALLPALMGGDGRTTPPRPTNLSEPPPA